MEDEFIHYVDLEMMNDRNEILRIIQKNLQKTKFKPDQQSAIQTYRGPGASINGNIRNSHRLGNRRPSMTGYDSHIKNLDDALKIAILEKTIRVYRGMHGPGQKLLAGMTIGDIFIDPAFLSTSLDPTIAINFAGASSSTPTKLDKRVMRITLVRGSKAVQACIGGECEIILPRSSKLRLERILPDMPYYIVGAAQPHYIDIYDFLPIPDEEALALEAAEQAKNKESLAKRMRDRILFRRSTQKT